jgi:hypothetical protein
MSPGVTGYREAVGGARSLNRTEVLVRDDPDLAGKRQALNAAVSTDRRPVTATSRSYF